MNSLSLIVLLLSCLCIVANAVDNKPVSSVGSTTSSAASAVSATIASDVESVASIVAKVMSKDPSGFEQQPVDWFKQKCITKKDTDKVDPQCKPWFGYNCIRRSFVNKNDPKIIPCQQFLNQAKDSAKEIVDGVTKFKQEEYKVANQLEEAGEASVAKLKATAGFTGEWKNDKGKSDISIASGSGSGNSGNSGNADNNNRAVALLQLRNKIAEASPYRKGASTAWPKGEINYYFATTISATDPIRTKVSTAIAEYTKNFGTCLKFNPIAANKTDVRRVKIQNSDSGCYVTKVGAPSDKSETVMNLASGCSAGNTKHEFMHVLGFDHTQKRPDRDSFVRVNTANIQSGRESQFTKLDAAKWDNKGDYQYNSIMHYPSTAFAKTAGLITIDGPLPVIPTTGSISIINNIAQAFAIVNANARAQMGQRAELKAVDIAAIKGVYSCK